MNLRSAWENVLDYLDRAKTGLIVTVLILIVLFIVLWPRIVVTIDSGEVGVLFRRFSGTEMDRTYREGLHIVFPWDTMYIYTVRWQTVEHDFDVLTNTGLPVTIKVAIRYRPDLRLIPELHTNVGPDYLNRIVIPETLAVLRQTVGRYSAEEVYTDQRGILDSVLIRSLSQSERRFVAVDEVLIKSVVLPDTIAKAIEEKLRVEQEEKAYEYKLRMEAKEAERKTIEARGIRDYQKIITETLDDKLLRWQGIQATRDLAKSPNAKTVVIGGRDGLPLILNPDR
jgi:regulator of protease activity HflC (stomatin/prohibitin superfamily)